ncbi:MAG: response regulator [Azospirillum sp.]|nr:response regulator [Azospirillum sp.]
MPDPAFQRYSVLLIEDEPFTRLVLAKQLAGLGFGAVYQAADGTAGLAAVERHRPDIVLCDVEMKPVDGLGFLAGLRSGGEPWRHALPVIFMTNRIDPAATAAAQTLGSDEFIVKPVQTPELSEKLGGRLFAAPSNGRESR